MGQGAKKIILWGGRWYEAYPISSRNLEEMRKERGVSVAHFTLNRWVISYAPAIEQQCCRPQCPVGQSWRLDKTDVKIKGQWASLYRAVEDGQTVDFLLTPQRERATAEAF